MGNVETAKAETPMVYKAINDVSTELLAGIGKNSKNLQQGFMFRGIDAVYNTLAPALAKHGLVIIPRVIERNVSEKPTKNGGVIYYVVIKAEFDFISVKDGSKITVVNFGEAMDSGDKGTNKAMSIAYKYAAFQTFCIPTEDTTDDPELYDYQEPAALMMTKDVLENAINAMKGVEDKATLQKYFNSARSRTNDSAQIEALNNAFSEVSINVN